MSKKFYDNTSNSKNEEEKTMLNYIHINYKNKIEEYTENDHIKEVMNFVNLMSESECSDIGIEINKFFQSVIPGNKEGDPIKVNTTIASKSKIEKSYVEECLNNIMNRTESSTLVLTKEVSEEISTVLKEIFTKIKRNKIKSLPILVEETKKLISDANYMNILNKYKTYRTDSKKIKEACYKFQKFPEDKDYDLPIEMLILIRKFDTTKKLKLTLGSSEKKTEINDYIFEHNDLINNIYVLLNLEWLFQNILEVEVDLKNSNLIYDQINLCRDNLKNFSHLFRKDTKITAFKTKGYNERNYEPHLHSNFYPKNTNVNEENNFFRLKTMTSNFTLNSINETNTNIDIINSKKKEKEKSPTPTEKFINKYTYSLEMIIIYAYFISKMPIIQCYFILPINLEYEILSMLKYKKIILNNFHFLSFLTNTNISSTTIDFNSLDNISFEKVLNFLNQNQNMSICRLSFFPPEEYLKPELLYKVLQDCDSTYRNINPGGALYNDRNCFKIFDVKQNEDIDNYMLRKLSEFFERNITKFLYLLTIKTSIKELTLIFDIPTILNKNDYFNSILLKFLLNLFIFIDKNQNHLNTLSIVAENFIFDTRKFPILNDFCEKLYFYQDIQNKISNLTFQVRIFELTNIYRLVPYNITYLSIGSFDYKTLISFVDYITSSDFSIHSNLNKLQINLNNTIVELNKVNEPILRILTDFPKNLKEINIYTYLNVKYNEVYDLLKKTNYNTLENIFFQFYKGSINNDKNFKDIITYSAINGEIKIDKFIELYYVARNIRNKKLLLNSMSLCSKINKNFMDYNIYLNIEKFLCKKQEKINIIQFK